MSAVITAAAGATAVRPPGLDVARDTMARRASSFALAARLLPADVREDIELLYATFRRLDDLVDDGEPDAARRIEAVRAWAAGDAGDAGEATPEVTLLEELHARRPFPRDAIADFCAGMRDDLDGVGFATERELDRYCYRVAGTVGVVMTAMLGSAYPAEARGCAAALGMAMQRTNILRDIDEDGAVGRVYISAEALSAPGASLTPGRRATLLRGQIARADELYDDGLLGVPLLARGRPAVVLAAGLYREILREIEREGLGASTGQVSVAPARRALTALRLVLAGR